MQENFNNYDETNIASLGKWLKEPLPEKVYHPIERDYSHGAVNLNISKKSRKISIKSLLD